MSQVLERLQIIMEANTANYTSEMREARVTARTTFQDIRERALSMRDGVQTAMAGLATTFAAVNVAMAAITTQQARLASDIVKQSQLAVTSAKEFQYWAVAAKKVGIEQDKLSDILKDVNDKVGDFLAGEGGEMVDFFKNIAPKIGMTAEEFRGLSGTEALLKYHAGLRKANVSSAEMVFYMESIADEATALIPLLENGGAELKKWGELAESTGAIMTDKLIAQAKEFGEQTSMAALHWQGFKNQLSEITLPPFTALMEEMTKIDGTFTNLSKNIITGLANISNWLQTGGIHQITGIFGVVAVGAMVKFGASVASTMPTLIANTKTMLSNTQATIANATSQQALSAAIINAQRYRVVATLAMQNYKIALAETLAASLAYIRVIPNKIAGLRTQAIAALATARSMMTLSAAQTMATNTAMLAGRGLVGMGTGLIAVGNVIKAHPLMFLASIITAIVIKTEGLQGAMKSLGDMVGLAGVMFEDFVSTAVDGWGMLLDVTTGFLGNFISGSKKSTMTATGYFSEMFKNTQGGFVGMVQVGASMLDKLLTHIVAFAKYSEQNLKSVGRNIEIFWTNGINVAIGAIEGLLKSGVRGLNALTDGVNPIIRALNSASSFLGGQGVISEIPRISEPSFDRRTVKAPLHTQDYRTIYRDNTINTARSYVDNSIDRSKGKQQQANNAVISSAPVYYGGTPHAGVENKAIEEGEKGKEGKVAKSNKSPDYQMMVYEAWIKAGLSEQQAKIMTAEVGRENSYRPEFLFGYHKDKNNGRINIGMLSWQKERGKDLEKHLRLAGLIKGNKIAQSQESLNAMAQFAVQEILNDVSFSKTKNEFLSNPNIKTQEAFNIVGRNYIRWDIDGKGKNIDAKKHANRRDNHYKQISAKVGNSDAVKNFHQDIKSQQKLIAEQNQLLYSYSDKATQLKQDLQEETATIKSLAFLPSLEKDLIDIATIRNKKNLEKYNDEQNKKVENYRLINKTEGEVILDEMVEKQKSVYYDDSLSAAQKKIAYQYIREEALYRNELRVHNLNKELFDAKKHHLSNEEQIEKLYQLERKEIELTLGMDERLRKAKFEQAEFIKEQALRETKLAYEMELQDIVSYGKTELEKMTDDFIAKRNANDRRTDINDIQKSELRDAITARHMFEIEQYQLTQDKKMSDLLDFEKTELQRIKDRYAFERREIEISKSSQKELELAINSKQKDFAITELQKSTANNFNALNAEMSGTKDFFDLQSKLDSRLEIIKKSLENEVISKEQAEKAKAKIEQDYAHASYQLQVNHASGIIDNIANMGKIILSENSKTYKRLFAINQSFVMAQAGINMYKAISDVWATGATLPQKIAGALVVSTELIKIITAAKQVKMQGFRKGGYTGNGGVNEVAGVVHGKEYVFDAESTKRIGVKNLDNIRRGGFNTGSNTYINVNVTVNNDGSSNIESSQQFGKNLGKAIKTLVRTELQKELRQGGML